MPLGHPQALAQRFLQSVPMALSHGAQPRNAAADPRANSPPPQGAPSACARWPYGKTGAGRQANHSVGMGASEWVSSGPSTATSVASCISLPFQPTVSSHSGCWCSLNYVPGVELGSHPQLPPHSVSLSFALGICLSIDTLITSQTVPRELPRSAPPLGKPQLCHLATCAPSQDTLMF